MSITMNIDGVDKTVDIPSVNIDDIWKSVSIVCNNIDGVWKQLYPEAIDYVDFTITSLNRSMIGYTNDTTDLVIPSTFTAEDGTNYKVIGIDSSAFSLAPLTSVTIPNSATTIGYMAFINCIGFTSLTIPSSVTNIGECAFNGCIYLTTVNYRGTEDQWNAITIGANNTPLTSDTINYNYTD